MTAKPTDTGMNRTGTGTSPLAAARTRRGADLGMGHMHDGQALEAERIRWARSSDPVGTVPPPRSVKGAVKTVIEKLEGHKPTVLVDKLGERLAFERTATRLYDALLAKLEAADLHEEGPTREELVQIRDDEHRHVHIVRDAIRHIGGDPTAMTPCADLVSVSGIGWVQAITDPHTTLDQCLNVILIAELADNDGWQLLIRLADSLGFAELTTQFRTALLEEQQHLVKLREWVMASVLGEAGAQTSQTQH